MNSTLQIQTLQDLVEYANESETNKYLFSTNTVKFFGTVFCDNQIYKGRYFITREKSRKMFTDKLYIVRSFHVYENGGVDITTVNYEGFLTLADARKYIANIRY